MSEEETSETESQHHSDSLNFNLDEEIGEEEGESKETIIEEQTVEPKEVNTQTEYAEEETHEKAPKRPAHELEILNDQELITYISEFETELKHLELENMVFENFLNRHDPSLIANMTQVLEAAMKVQLQTKSITSQSSELTGLTGQAEASTQGSRTSSTLRLPTTTVTVGDKGPRINITQRTDLVMRETEEIQVNLEKFIQKSHRTKCNLRAELEEIDMRDHDVKVSRDIFEETIVIGGVDKLTQRIPAEKFMRYIEEWLKDSEFTLEKLRLRTSSLRSQFVKMSKQLVMKQEMSENLQAVDFEQLHIENTHYQAKCEAKNMHLVELKKMNGRLNLMLSLQKLYLQDQVKELNQIHQKIKAGEAEVNHLDKLCEDVEAEVGQAHVKYDHLKEIQSNYKVPDVLEYVRIKDKLYELKRSMKVWTRRINIQNIALEACTTQMKSLTGIKKARPSWYKLADFEFGYDFCLN